MRSNPYVYPSINFPNLLSKAHSKKEMVHRNVNWKNIKQDIKKIKYKTPKVTGKTVEERILSIFLDPCFLFGSRTFINDSKKEFLNTICHFIKLKKPINISLLGFPFKMEVPVKTNRFLPDMGEILVLNKLFFLAECIRKEYPPGVKINIFTEECFAQFAKNNNINAKAYVKNIGTIINKLNYSRVIRTISLSDVEKLPEFKKTFSKNITIITRDIKSKKGKGHKKYKKSFTSVFRIISTKNISDDILLSIYRVKNINFLSKTERFVYQKIAKQTEIATIKYLAYIKTKDDLQFVKKILGTYLPLTVSPKHGRIGILPIRKDVVILPYHGVPVKDVKSGKWDIRYLCEIKYGVGKYEAVYLKKDRDKNPFYYLRFK